MSDDWNIAFYRARLSPTPTDPITNQTLINAGIDQSYWGTSISRIPEDLPYRAALRRIVDNLHTEERTGKGAIFHGKYASGKTACSCICLKSAIARGGQGFFVPSVEIEPAFERRVFHCTPEGIQVWDTITRVHFLVIDDMGAELSRAGYKAGDTRVFETVIRSRYNKRLPTFITTNLPLPQIMETYVGISTILLDPTRYEFVHVDGKNWRKREE